MIKDLFISFEVSKMFLHKRDIPLSYFYYNENGELMMDFKQKINSNKCKLEVIELNRHKYPALTYNDFLSFLSTFNVEIKKSSRKKNSYLIINHNTRKNNVTRVYSENYYELKELVALKAMELYQELRR